MFLLYLIFVISLGVGNILASSVSISAANAATKKLNAQTLSSSDNLRTQPVETNLPPGTTLSKENNLKVIERLTTVYNILKAKEDVRFAVFSPNRVLHPSDKDESIVDLRDILQSLGYLDKASDSPFYDVALEEVVKTFQAAHCIEPDGVIGEETKARLNWSFARRLQMLQESISMLKKMVFADKTLIVNIPTYRVHCFEGDKQVLEMKAIVGQPKRATPLMTSYINAITYYPQWVLPKRIFFEDKLPAIQKDEDYFEKNNLEIFEVNGESEEAKDPSEIDWSEIHEYDFPYLVKQKPGKKNALGVLQFMLLNNEQIYLHDTPQKSLFKKFSRALSSGCIRVEKPMTLAAWMLKKDKDAIKEDLENEETKVKPLKGNVLVQITYLPVWVLDDGKMLWGDDPYKLQTQPQT
jgi:murein L,D-transpeptidase YcbB/YkuD